MERTITTRLTRRQMLIAATMGGLGASGLLAACGAPATPTPAPTKPAQSTQAPAPAAQPTQPPAAATAAPAASAQASPQGTKPPAASTAPAAAQATAAPAPAAGGILNAAFETDPIMFDQHASTAFTVAVACEHVYESLTAFDKNLKIIPSLADSWEVAPDGLSWVFKLNPKVKWHDGSEFTSEDVRWSISRLLSPEVNTPWSAMMKPLIGAEVVDKYTVKYKLQSPLPYLNAMMASLRGGMMIFPKDADKKYNIKVQAIGTGPFKLKEYVANDHVYYTKNPDYRIPGVPKLDEIRAKIMVDEEARIAALRGGAIDYAIVGEQGAQRLATVGALNVLTAPGSQMNVVWFPGPKSPYSKAFQDPRVRQAFTLAIDRDEIIKKAVNGNAAWTGPVPAGFGNWPLSQEEIKPYLARNVAKAKELLAAAGYPDGKGFPPVKLQASTVYPWWTGNATVMQQNLKDVGLNLEIEQPEWGIQQKRSNEMEQELHFTFHSFQPDPDLYLWNYYYSKSGSSHVQAGRYLNTKQAELDTMLDQFRVWTGSDAERRELGRKIQNMILAEPPMLWLYVRNNIEVVQSYVKGYWQSFTTRRPGLWDAYVEKR